MLNPVPLLGREFHINRGKGGKEFVMVYPFRCGVSIYEDAKEPNRKKLNDYFAMLMRYGCPSPEGKGSVSQQKKLMVGHERVESDLTGHAEASMYQGLGEKQHRCVQDYLHT